VEHLDVKLAMVGLAINTVGLTLQAIAYYLIPASLLVKLAWISPLLVAFGAISVATSLIMPSPLNRKISRILLQVNVLLEIAFLVGILGGLFRGESGLFPLFEVWPWVLIAPLLACFGAISSLRGTPTTPVRS
jgi:hypothetical protein